MSASLRVFESGEEHPLDIAGLEKDLAALWREASRSGKGPAMRASRANLVVLVRGADRRTSGEAQLEALMPTIARCYPSRVLVVRVGARGEHGTLMASVSALCTLRADARYLCCERIELEAAAGAEPSIPGTILALLIGELPLVLWTPSEPPLAESWFSNVLSSSDRLLIDSARWSNPSGIFRRLDHAARTSGRLEIADHEWLRCAPWRGAIASAFEPAEARAAARNGFETITFVEAGLRNGGSAPARRAARAPSVPASAPSGSATAPSGSATAPTGSSSAPSGSANALSGTESASGGPARASHASSQDILADEPRLPENASAASVLLHAWIRRRVSVRRFLWLHAGTEIRKSTSPRGAAPAQQIADDAAGSGSFESDPSGDENGPDGGRFPLMDRSCGLVQEDPSRGIHVIRFEAVMDGKPFVIEVPAPHEEDPPPLSDFATLLAGQKDHPFSADAASTVPR